MILLKLKNLMPILRISEINPIFKEMLIDYIIEKSKILLIKSI